MNRGRLARLLAIGIKAVQRLGRWQKMAVLIATDGLLAPLTLGAVLWLDAAPHYPLWGLLLVPISAGLSWLLGLPRIRFKAYDGSGMLLSALHAAGLAMLGATFARGQLLAGPGAAGWVAFALLMLCLAVGLRLLGYRLLLALYRHGVPCRAIIIYGAGTTGMQLAAALKRDPEQCPLAFVDDNPALQGLVVAGLRVHPPDRIARLTAGQRGARVILAMPGVARTRQAEILAGLRARGLEAQALPSFAALIDGQGRGEPGRPRPICPGEVLGRGPVAAAGDLGPLCRGRVVAVTGAGGSIGAELCRQVLALAPARLVLIDHGEFALYTIERELLPLARAAGVVLQPCLASIQQAERMREALQGVGLLLHAAAYKHVPMVEANPLAGLGNNVLGTEVLARAAIAAGVARFVMVSTDKAVRPTSVMGASKRLAEIVIQDLAARQEAGRGCTFAMVRFGNVLGSSGSVLPLFQEQIAQGGPLTVTDPEMTRYFMTVDEAAVLVLQAGSMACGGELFLLDMGLPVRIGDLARRVIAASGCRLRDASQPDGEIAILETGLRPGEKRHEELLIGAHAQATAHPRILVAREAFPPEMAVAAMLRDLRAAIAAGAPEAARRVMRRWVEGYAPLEATACPAEAADWPEVALNESRMVSPP